MFTNVDENAINNWKFIQMNIEKIAVGNISFTVSFQNCQFIVNSIVHFIAHLFSVRFSRHVRVLIK